MSTSTFRRSVSKAQSLDEHKRSRTLLVIVCHIIDPGAYRIAPRLPFRIVGLVRFTSKTSSLDFGYAERPAHK
jgi:hypothetical protein